jgi:exonuclease III
VRLISWNVNRRTSLLAEQAAALASRAPDVVALQEVTAASLLAWRAAMPEVGLAHVLCSLDAADPARTPPRRRRTGVLLAARDALSPLTTLPVPWPETSLGATVDGVAVHTVHVPNAANGWTKVRTLEAIRRGLAGAAAPTVVCGDLNTPRRELPDGTVVSFARDSRARLRPERGVEWDEGELGVVPGLRDLGFADAFRALHGYERREPSWIWPHGGGWRLDHVFCSAELRPMACVYHHEWRDRGLSDHSAIEADVVPASL